MVGMACLALVLTLAGCSGGSSSGGGATTGNPALAYGFNVFTPNYVADLEHVLWWRSFPLTIAFTNDITYNGQSAQAHFKSGFDAWMSATGGAVATTWVTDPSKAQITVRFAKITAPQQGEELGVTVANYYQSSLEMVSAEVTINLWDGMTPQQFANDVATATHEMGHALGISGHSTVKADLMYPSFNLNESIALTARDVNTLKSLYPQLFVKTRALPPPPSTGPVVTVRMP
jgi:predicted Zn-dependent protease